MKSLARGLLFILSCSLALPSRAAGFETAMRVDATEKVRAAVAAYNHAHRAYETKGADAFFAAWPIAPSRLSRQALLTHIGKPMELPTFEVKGDQLFLRQKGQKPVSMSTFEAARGIFRVNGTTYHYRMKRDLHENLERWLRQGPAARTSLIDWLVPSAQAGGAGKIAIAAGVVALGFLLLKAFKPKVASANDTQSETAGATPIDPGHEADAAPGGNPGMGDDVYGEDPAPAGEAPPTQAKPDVDVPAPPPEPKPDRGVGKESVAAYRTLYCKGEEPSPLATALVTTGGAYLDDQEAFGRVISSYALEFSLMAKSNEGLSGAELEQRQSERSAWLYYFDVNGGKSEEAKPLMEEGTGEKLEDRKTLLRSSVKSLEPAGCKDGSRTHCATMLLQLNSGQSIRVTPSTPVTGKAIDGQRANKIEWLDKDGKAYLLCERKAP